MKPLLIFLVLCLGCSHQEQANSTFSEKNESYVRVKHNLYVNPNSGELYFLYSIPERKLLGNSESVTSHDIYDSLVIYEKEIVKIASIIDSTTYNRSDSLEHFFDKNYFYKMRETNISPKFEAIKR